MKKAKTFSNVRSFNKRTTLKQSLRVFIALLFVSNNLLANYTLPITPSDKMEQSVSTSQEKIIRGKVIDANSQLPLAGVTIKVVGKSTATSTDDSGNFEITAFVNDVLEITYIGYLKSEAPISPSTNTLSIELNQDLSSLADVVVTGYGSQRKMDLTGAVAVVDAAQLKSTPAASAVESLQGRATGVQIVADGAPGSTPQIKIRGFSTINNNEPLYVIDGVPFEGKLSWLNQNDIETMQVLKDASAASIYGSRANNGVVIITTRTGRAGKAQINIDSYYGFQVPKSGSFPKMLTPQQVLDFDNALNGTNEILPDYLLAGSISGHNITTADADISKYNYDGKDRSTFYQITRANKEGTNWFEELSQNAPTQSYQINASGGSETATYAMSGGYLGQKGSLVHTGFEKFNIRTNTRFKAFDSKLRVGENLQYSHTEGFGIGVNPNTAGGYQGEGSVLGYAYRIQNIIPVYDEGGNFAGSYGGWGNGEQPVAMAFRAKDNKNRSNFFFGNAFGEYDLITGLTMRSNFGLRYENYNGLGLNYPNPEFSEGSFNNGMSEYHGYFTEWTWTNTLSFNPSLGDDHQLTLLTGTEAIKSRGRDLSGSRNSYFTLNSLDYFYLNAGTSNIGNASSGSVGSLFSLFAKGDYSFKDRYLLSLTVRRDGSSNFGSNNLYGTFPGISGAWRISEEDFMRDTEWLTDLKVRAGYGITGNQRIPGYQYLNRFASSLTQSSYPINGTTQSGIWQSAYANEDVKWEQVKSLNLGLDFTILNGDIDGSFDWYNKTTDDMLYRLPLPAIAVGRAESPYVNIGSMNNKGVEFSLGYHYGHRQRTPFTVDLSANISRNKNEIVALAPSVDQQIFGLFRSMETSILKVGEPYAAFFGYQTTGIYQDASDIANSPSYPGARPGGLKYADINNDGIIDAEDRTIIGSPHPDFVYSFNLNTTFKNFDFMMYFYGSQGNDLYEATRYFTDFGVFKGQKSVRLLDSWSPNNTRSTTPSLANDASGYEYASSSYYVQDGSFLKLKNIQLGYNIPTQNLFKDRNSFQKLRVYFGVTNLFTVTNYEGLDPEISATSSDYPALGVDFGIYPQARQYLLGLSLGF